jgi:membrane-associated phospholipid phosphatase
MATEDPQLPLGARIVHTLALYAGAMTIYFAAGHAARPPYVSVSTALDDALPFLPWAMAGYALCYVVPASLIWLETSQAGVRRLSRAVLLAYLMAAPFFLAMPVQDADPPVEASNGAEHALVINRGLDTTKNAFPSMHVGLAVLLAFVGHRRSKAWGWTLGLAAALIIVSTLFVKQHFLVDLPAGALVGWLAFRISYGKAAES